jgi:hypothetical protein
MPLSAVAHALALLLRQAGEGVRDLHEALLLRNDEYQKLLARATAAEADRRELAAQAAGLRQAAQAAQVGRRARVPACTRPACATRPGSTPETCLFLLTW